MLFQFLPRLSDDEYTALEKSIREHGVMVPIVVDEKRSIIDGHHRKEIADRLGIECPRKHVWDLAEDQKRTLALSLNLDRRHLNREQKRAVLTKSLAADPELSDREHAKRVGVDHKTVGSRRAELEATGEIPQTEKRTSADGRVRPAQQPTRTSDPHVDTGTGEVSDVWFADDDSFYDGDDYLPNDETGEEVTTSAEAVAAAVDTEGAPGEEVEPSLPSAPSRPAVTGIDGKTCQPPAKKATPSPAPQAAPDWTLRNAEQAAEGIATAVMSLHALTVESAFERFVAVEWPRGYGAASPALRDRMTPQHFREIAQALNRLADQWEGTPS